MASHHLPTSELGIWIFPATLNCLENVTLLDSHIIDVGYSFVCHHEHTYSGNAQSYRPGSNTIGLLSEQA